MQTVVVVPGRVGERPVVAIAAGESVHLLIPGEEEELQLLHTVYGHPVTCLDASDALIAFGVKRAGWAMHDGGNKVGSPSLYFYFYLLFLFFYAKIKGNTIQNIFSGTDVYDICLVFGFLFKLISS